MLSKIDPNSRFVGFKQSKRAIENGDASCAYIAEDCEPLMRQSLETLCRNQNVKIEYLPTMKQLGTECGIEVDAAVDVIRQSL